MEVTGRAGAQHREGFIDVLRRLVAGNDGARRICFLKEVVAVVRVNACSCRGGLVNAPAKRVIFEGDCATASRFQTFGRETQLR